MTTVEKLLIVYIGGAVLDAANYSRQNQTTFSSEIQQGRVWLWPLYLGKGLLDLAAQESATTASPTVPGTNPTTPPYPSAAY